MKKTLNIIKIIVADIWLIGFIFLIYAVFVSWDLAIKTFIADVLIFILYIAVSKAHKEAI